jgi:hypothetical protein
MVCSVVEKHWPRRAAHLAGTWMPSSTPALLLISLASGILCRLSSGRCACVSRCSFCSFSVGSAYIQQPCSLSCELENARNWYLRPPIKKPCRIILRTQVRMASESSVWYRALRPSSANNSRKNRSLKAMYLQFQMGGNSRNPLYTLANNSDDSRMRVQTTDVGTCGSKSITTTMALGATAFCFG